MLKDPQLFRQGFHLSQTRLPDSVKEAVLAQDWEKLDQEFRILTAPDAALFRFLLDFHDFDKIEFIISIRDAQNEWEEDGVWHDDGSRVFAFSLSLTLWPEAIKGGHLGIRKKGEDTLCEIPTPPLGTIILFLTGKYGFEHKIHKVEKGCRIVIAGWCS